MKIAGGDFHKVLTFLLGKALWGTDPAFRFVFASATTRLATRIRIGRIGAIPIVPHLIARGERR
ncbi:hypothetical protein P3T25_003021 [Paraburkholderia sp. GAS32]